MKAQYIIFLLVIVGIIFLVYPSNTSDIDEARERILERQQQSDMNSEEVIVDEGEIEITDNENGVVQDMHEDINVTNYENPEQWPLESVEVTEIMELDTPSYLDYGDAVATSDTSFIYNQVRGLEIFREQFEEKLACEDITDFLANRINAWYYWNTCRFIDWERWLKFNVLRLEWDQYVYERHYIDIQASLYGILILERWDWIDRENIQEKNIEFSDKEFPIKEVWDGLMRELIRIN